MKWLMAALLPAALLMGADGLFEGHSDVGAVVHKGSVEYDSSNRRYTVAGSGENMWFATDGFHFLWKKVSGDITIAADVSFVGAGGDPHRKAVLMMRQSLDAGAAYADAALHGDGLTSLQVREEKGAATHEIQSRVSAPQRLRLTKRGKYFYMSIGGEGEETQLGGGWMRVPLEEPFYIGIGVCSHKADALEKAVFSNIELKTPPAKTPVLYSTLETVPVASTDRRVAYLAPGRIQSPNWTRDGASLLFDSDGRVRRLSIADGKAATIDTGFATRCGSFHGLSPDGALLAISDHSQEEGNSLIYTVPAAGGAPHRVTAQWPSYWHGWSPDGSRIAFSGKRDGRTD